jgi:hypothetical protein
VAAAHGRDVNACDWWMEYPLGEGNGCFRFLGEEGRVPRNRECRDEHDTECAEGMEYETE